jgi:hypothetical protein
LSTTNITCCPDANPDHRGGKPLELWHGLTFQVIKGFHTWSQSHWCRRRLLLTGEIFFQTMYFCSYVCLTHIQMRLFCLLKRYYFWGITQRSPLKVNQRFGGACRLRNVGWH